MERRVGWSADSPQTGSGILAHNRAKRKQNMLISEEIGASRAEVVAEFARNTGA